MAVKADQALEMPWTVRADGTTLPTPVGGKEFLTVDSVDAVEVPGSDISEEREFKPIKAFMPCWFKMTEEGALAHAPGERADGSFVGVRAITLDNREIVGAYLNGIAKGRRVIISPTSPSRAELRVLAIED